MKPHAADVARHFSSRRVCQLVDSRLSPLVYYKVCKPGLKPRIEQDIAPGVDASILEVEIEMTWGTARFCVRFCELAP